VFAWVLPAPPDTDVAEEGPNFLGRPFSEMNLLKNPIGSNEAVVGYHDAQPFTRFYGTIACDQPLEVTISFSNDDVDAKGIVVNDDNISTLHYDGEALKQLYDPKKQGPTGKFFVTIYGRFLRVEVKNVGAAPTKELRAYVRGSVF
jgi:hypothetical protein